MAIKSKQQHDLDLVLARVEIKLEACGVGMRAARRFKSIDGLIKGAAVMSRLDVAHDLALVIETHTAVALATWTVCLWLCAQPSPELVALRACRCCGECRPCHAVTQTYGCQGCWCGYSSGSYDCVGDT